MTPEDIFGVAIRIAGLLLILRALLLLPGVYWPDKEHTSQEYVFSAILNGGLGAILIVVADILVEMCY